MSANILVFDAQYIQEQVRTLRRSEQIIAEAVNMLKQASLHRGWKCPECNTINSRLDEISKYLGRLDRGITSTANALARSSERFAELESRSESQTQSLSNNLREKHGFTAFVRGRRDTANLPVTRIPEHLNTVATFFKEAIRVNAMAVGSAIGAIAGGIIGTMGGLAVGLVNDIAEELISVAKSAQSIFMNQLAILTTPLQPHAGEYISILKEKINVTSNGFDAVEFINQVKGNKELLENADFQAAGKVAGGLSNGVTAVEAVTNLNQLVNAVKNKADTAETREIAGDLTDSIASLTPIMGLDKTVLKGTGGALNGIMTGTDIGMKYTAKLMEKIFGKSTIPGLNSENIQIQTANQRYEKMFDDMGLDYVHDVAGPMVFDWKLEV